MSERTWERIGALSGLQAAILFGAAFVIFLTTDPMGTPRVPDVANAADASAFIRDHQDALKVQLLLNSAAILAFVWFLGSLWSRLRAAEGGPARVAAIASAGGIVGAAAVLAGIVFEATAVLLPTGVDVTTLYVLSVMSIGLGGAAFTVFFLAAGKVILQTRALPVVTGAVAIVAAAASALGLGLDLRRRGNLQPGDGRLRLLGAVRRVRDLGRPGEHRADGDRRPRAHEDRENQEVGPLAPAERASGTG